MLPRRYPRPWRQLRWSLEPRPCSVSLSRRGRGRNGRREHRSSGTRLHLPRLHRHLRLLAVHTHNSLESGPRSRGCILAMHSTNEESFMPIGKRFLPNAQGIRESHPAGNSCFIRCWKVTSGSAGMPVCAVGPQRSLQPVYKYIQGKYTGKPVSDSQCAVPLNSIAL